MAITTLSTLEFHQNHKDWFWQGEPFLVKGFAARWDCVQSETLHLLKAQAEIPILCDDGQYRPLGQVIDSLDTPDCPNVRFSTVANQQPALKEIFHFSDLKLLLVGPSQKTTTALFIGKRDLLTPLHGANVCNYFLQTQGRKRWWIYPSTDEKELQMKALDRHWRSELLPSSVPDAYGKSRFQRDGWDFVTEPGDLLYNPPFYWHCVLNLETSVAFSLRWLNLVASFRASPRLTTQQMFSRKSTLLSILSEASQRKSKKDSGERYL